MQVATINETRWQAREKYAEYLRGVKERLSDELEAIKNGYRELSRGRQVLDLVATMQQAGVDEQQRPRLAIVRADAQLCWYGWRNVRGEEPWKATRPTFSMSRDWKPAKSRCVQLPRETLPEPRRTCRAIVPTIPPRLMPAGKLSNFHILWEAEWENVPIDPMLLKHLGKSLYVVLATWDLTPLEQAVLRDRG